MAFLRGATLLALAAALTAGAGVPSDDRPPGPALPATAAATPPTSPAPDTASLPTPRGSWVWPVQPRPQVLRRFDIGPAPWSPGHRGVDLSASAGARIRAPAAGVVSFTGVVTGRPVISIDQGGGLISSMEPVLATVRRGDAVTAGQVIGTLSPLPGHCAPAACLHWGVRSAGRYIDPLALVKGASGPIILLPDL